MTALLEGINHNNIIKLRRIESLILYTAYHDTLLLIDAQGLTDAINNTGRVYKEIGNMHGQQVSSVLVYSLPHVTVCDLLYGKNFMTCENTVVNLPQLQYFAETF